MLHADDGKRFGFARVVAAKPSTPTPAASYPSVGGGAAPGGAVRHIGGVRHEGGGREL
jgi:hypothetical protein